MESGQPTELVFAVANMKCEGCATTIQKTLRAMPGVRDVSPKVAEKRVVVRYDPAQVREGDLKQALDRIGYPAVVA